MDKELESALKAIEKIPLHPIDHKKKHWTRTELQKFMTFCLLDSNIRYASVCAGFDAIFADIGKEKDAAKHLIQLGRAEMVKRLKKAGYTYYNRAPVFLLKWARSEYSLPEKLKTARREELVENVAGIGFKLGSMFLRNTRGDNFAVLDRHIVRWLGIKSYKATPREYVSAERRFMGRAAALGLDPYKLDIAVWEMMRVKYEKNRPTRAKNKE